jgi:hypothetical protein
VEGSEGALVRIALRVVAVLVILLGVALILPFPILLANGAAALAIGSGFLDPASVGDWLARGVLSVPMAGIGIATFGLAGFLWNLE